MGWEECSPPRAGVGDAAVGAGHSSQPKWVLRQPLPCLMLSVSPWTTRLNSALHQATVSRAAETISWLFTSQREVCSSATSFEPVLVSVIPFWYLQLACSLHSFVCSFFGINEANWLWGLGHKALCMHMCKSSQFYSGRGESLPLNRKNTPDNIASFSYQ